MRGYKEEGTTTTPFDMVMLNDLDRFHLVMDVIDRVPGFGARAAHLRQEMVDERLRHRAYTRELGDDRARRPRLDLATASARSQRAGAFDALVFTGGVGENSPGIRAWAAAGLGFLGVRGQPGTRGQPRDLRVKSRATGSDRARSACRSGSSGGCHGSLE